MIISKEDIKRFWSKVKKKRGKGCWEWQASKVYGYGQFYVPSENSHRRAHRVSWIIKNGKIPNDLLVLHKCDNRACIRPDHLFLGTHQDNENDKISKGRQAVGSKSGSSKLTEKQVSEIRGRYNTGKYTTRELAKIYKVCQRTICVILRYIAWRHI